MAYKINAPYNKDDMNIAVYRRNLEDGSVGKSNHTGIIVQGGLDPQMEEAVVAHETVHQHQQRNGELDYDENNFYYKGKTYPRMRLDEHNKNLPWEKEAYKESDKILKQKQMNKGFKLDGYRGNKTNKFSELSSKGLIGGPDMRKPKKYKKGGDLFSATSYKPLQLVGGETSEVTQKREWSTMYKGKPQSKVTLKKGEKIDPSQVSGYDISTPTIDVKTTDISDKPIKRDFQSKTTGVYRKKSMNVDGKQVEFANPVVEVKTTTGAQPGTSKKVEITKYRKKDNTAKKTKTYEGKKYKKGVRKGERLTAGKYRTKSGDKKKRFAKAKIGGHSGLSPQGRAQIEKDFNIKSNRLEDVSIKRS